MKGVRLGTVAKWSSAGVGLGMATYGAYAATAWPKIAWTLRADPQGDDASIFRTETRAIATDATARSKFRRYWSLVSPGIILIRVATLGPIRDEAERRARTV
jgi:hypothetical protein